MEIGQVELLLGGSPKKAGAPAEGGAGTDFLAALAAAALAFPGAPAQGATEGVPAEEAPGSAPAGQEATVPVALTPGEESGDGEPPAKGLAAGGVPAKGLPADAASLLAGLALAPLALVTPPALAQGAGPSGGGAEGAPRAAAGLKVDSLANAPAGVPGRSAASTAPAAGTPAEVGVEAEGAADEPTIFAVPPAPPKDAGSPGREAERVPPAAGAFAAPRTAGPDRPSPEAKAAPAGMPLEGAARSASRQPQPVETAAATPPGSTARPSADFSFQAPLPRDAAEAAPQAASQVATNDDGSDPAAATPRNGAAGTQDAARAVGFRQAPPADVAAAEGAEASVKPASTPGRVDPKPEAAAVAAEPVVAAEAAVTAEAAAEGAADEPPAAVAGREPAGPKAADAGRPDSPSAEKAGAGERRPAEAPDHPAQDPPTSACPVPDRPAVNRQRGETAAAAGDESLKVEARPPAARGVHSEAEPEAGPLGDGAPPAAAPKSRGPDAAHGTQAQSDAGTRAEEVPAAVRAPSADPGSPAESAPARAPARPGATPTEQVTHAIRLSMSPSGDRVTVELEPEHLGRVEVVLTREPAGLVANFRVETATAQSALTADAAALRRELEAQGIPLVKVSVELEGQSAERRGPRDERRPARRSAAASAEAQGLAPGTERSSWRISAFETTA